MASTVDSSATLYTELINRAVTSCKAATGHSYTHDMVGYVVASVGAQIAQEIQAVHQTLTQIRDALGAKHT